MNELFQPWPVLPIKTGNVVPVNGGQVCFSHDISGKRHTNSQGDANRWKQGPCTFTEIESTALKASNRGRVQPIEGEGSG
jgi:hypothetical protein